MSDDRHRPLRDDVRSLGAILGETLERRGGERLYRTVEEVRALAKRAREARAGQAVEAALEGKGRKSDRTDHGPDRELTACLDRMPLEDAVPVARAFAQFLGLANIAEQHHRTRRRRAYRAGADALPQPGSPDAVFAELVAEGLSPDRLYRAVAELEIELVLTAHPTEAARRTTLRKHRRVASLLEARDRPDATDFERDEIDRALRRVVLELWETDEVRHEKPSPLDEVRFGLAVVEQSLWEVVPRFVRALDDALERHTGRRLPATAAPVRFASWMGGDRDGNPHVTARVTERAVLLSRWMAADLFLRDVEQLRDELSIDVATDELRALAGTAREPYRALLRSLRDRLAATRTAIEHRLGVAPSTASRDPSRREGETFPEDPLTDLDAFVAPLRIARRSLVACGCRALADGPLLDTLRRVACFGTMLLRLDLRQDASLHARALDAVTRELGLGGYLDWSEPKRMRWLAAELASPRPLVPHDLPCDAEVREVLDTFHMAARQPPGALGAYVISMCRSASDVLAVRLLQKACGVDPALRVVPLFETEADLERAGDVLDDLFEIDPYRRAIDDRQEVMIGYSDSTKDSGRFAAGWALYRAQERIVASCRAHGVRATLFHGRGGTIGRGGGPTWLAIRSQPPGSVEGRLRVTEQGEMIEAKFGLAGIAARTLELYVTSVVAKTCRAEPAPDPAWRDTMDRLAAAAGASYRRMLHDTPGFIDYFHHATPIEELGHLRLGSRPARRKPGRDLASLRAIPWIFSWTQVRLMVPTWLGLDEAVGDEIEAGRLAPLLRMYREWPFFRSQVDLIEMALAKADTHVAAAYEARLVPEPLRELGETLRRRALRAASVVRTLANSERLLDKNPVLRRSIDVRNPYVDPINLIQVELLRRLREPDVPAEDVEILRHALMVTITGIASGLRNTG